MCPSSAFTGESAPESTAELSVRRRQPRKKPRVLDPGVVTDKRHQGRLTSRTLQAATGGKTWRKVLLGGQSINCESIKKKKGWEMATGQGAVSGQQWWWRSRRVLGKRCSLKACGKTQDAGEDEDWGCQHIREESEEPSGRKRMLRVAAPNQSTHRGAL